MSLCETGWTSDGDLFSSPKDCQTKLLDIRIMYLVWAILEATLLSLCIHKLLTQWPKPDQKRTVGFPYVMLGVPHHLFFCIGACLHVIYDQFYGIHVLATVAYILSCVFFWTRAVMLLKIVVHVFLSIHIPSRIAHAEKTNRALKFIWTICTLGSLVIVVDLFTDDLEVKMQAGRAQLLTYTAASFICVLMLDQMFRFAELYLADLVKSGHLSDADAATNKYTQNKLRLQRIATVTAFVNASIVEIALCFWPWLQYRTSYIMPIIWGYSSFPVFLVAVHYTTLSYEDLEKDPNPPNSHLERQHSEMSSGRDSSFHSPRISRSRLNSKCDSKTCSSPSSNPRAILSRDIPDEDRLENERTPTTPKCFISTSYSESACINSATVTTPSRIQHPRNEDMAQEVSLSVLKSQSSEISTYGRSSSGRNSDILSSSELSPWPVPAKREESRPLAANVPSVVFTDVFSQRGEELRMDEEEGVKPQSITVSIDEELDGLVIENGVTPGGMLPE
eukprot:gb/GEZN01005401.1/.p1 GENE.gb/GEZN01005401.1/~~gb/GEZN01005401.1/.p1  ORF type:complete len:505 (+),score=31.96 gb/GEZN01005401.1/:129-1643(+)